ncbi:MAG: hypothetical protein FJ368_07100 [Pelagibacterales bacterium]|nr:hypothetical protein [Pelagibacterales bacterium]
MKHENFSTERKQKQPEFDKKQKKNTQKPKVEIYKRLMDGSEDFEKTIIILNILNNEKIIFYKNQSYIMNEI